MTTTTYAVDCPPCQHTGPTVLHADEADQLAAVHDHLHHRGRPTATVTTIRSGGTPR